MNIIFTYETERDVWCLLNKGRASNNSSMPTRQYEMLVAQYGNDPSRELATLFVRNYIQKQHIDIQQLAINFQTEWDDVSMEYQRRAVDVFGVTIDEEITAYLTINSRCPYNLALNYFFVSITGTSMKQTVMHELWHFYTWYKFGKGEEKKIGNEKYNALKEALTVLLNDTCHDLLPPGVVDKGYPQHKDLREQMLRYWKTERNIETLWRHFADQLL